jgi:type 1 glutamine amidotransferase
MLLPKFSKSQCYPRVGSEMRSTPLPLVMLLVTLWLAPGVQALDRLVFEPPAGTGADKHIVLVSGDEEYRTEETMPMLGKLLSQKHGFKCTVLFALAADGQGYIDCNNQSGVVGWEELDDADLMIIGTRFRTPSKEDSKHITDFLNAGKPIIGIRTSTHAFRGEGDFDGIPYGKFGRRILGEEWVSHHGRHKKEGARSFIEDEFADHPVLNGVGEIFCPSDVYGVIHLEEDDKILMRAGVTKTLDPESELVEGEKNDPMQPFVWMREYKRPDGSGTGASICTTGGASVDFVDEDLRRLIVNASYFLTGRDVPAEADVKYVDPYYPSFYGFIREKGYFASLNRRPEDFALGKAPIAPDPEGSPEWNFRPRPQGEAVGN